MSNHGLINETIDMKNATKREKITQKLHIF